MCETFGTLQVAKISPANAIKIEIRQPSALVLVKKAPAEGQTPVWAFESGAQPVDDSKVSAYLSNVSSVYAKDVLDPTGADYGFSETPLAHVTETKDGAETVTAEIFVGKHSDEKKTTSVKVLPKNAVFEIGDGYLESLKKDKTFFLKPEPEKK